MTDKMKLTAPQPAEGHTPLPWDVEVEGGELKITDCYGITATVHSDKTTPDAEAWANARLIVRAVNREPLAVKLAEAVLEADAKGRRDIPERVCELARQFLAAGKGE